VLNGAILNVLGIGIDRDVFSTSFQKETDEKDSMKDFFSKINSSFVLQPQRLKKGANTKKEGKNESASQSDPKNPLILPPSPAHHLPGERKQPILLGNRVLFFGRLVLGLASGLEAFSREPPCGSIGALAARQTPETRGMAWEFLSYYPRLPSRCLRDPLCYLVQKKFPLLFVLPARTTK